MGSETRKEKNHQATVTVEQRLEKSLKIIIEVSRLKCISDRTLRKLKASPPPLVSSNSRSSHVRVPPHSSANKASRVLMFSYSPSSQDLT